MNIQNNWWKEFFSGEYVDVVLTTDAKPICALMQQVGTLKNGMRAYDQCCGKGTLSHALAECGLTVYGCDLSEPLISIANGSNIENCHLSLNDANTYQCEHQVDWAINWNTSFGYSEEDAENMKMLHNLSENLCDGGQFLICTMNPLFVHRHFQRFIVKQVPYQDSTIITIRESFIENEFLKSEWTIIYPDGKRLYRHGKTKMYSLEQLTGMLASQNMQVEKSFGDVLMAEYDCNHPNLIVYGHKRNH